MSKLGDRIRQTLRAEPTPIGFAAAAARTARPSLLLAVVLGSLSADRARQAASGGADTCLFAVGEPKDAELTEALQALGETPAGLLTRQADRDSLNRLAQLGVDYLALVPEAAPATALLHPHLGRVLVLEADLPDALLRTVEAMPFDAVYLRSWKGPLTVRSHMELLRVVAFSRKPLMVPLAPQAEGADLEALREAGVVLVAVDGDRRENLEALPGLRQAIDALPPRRRRREERPEAVLPAPRPAPAAVAAEEEEEEEEGV